MFKRKSVNVAALIALGAVMFPVLAQTTDQPQKLDRVEVTGSSIKRVDAEGALPVITLTRKDIERTGATSVRDLVQMLPSMQGFTTSSESVNGLGGGTATAALRNLSEVYTLVLLNGRRVAPFDTGSTVNLEQLPLAAVERVEVLADGASALYGADAIAGVVNFITKQNTESGEVDLRYLAPERAGGKQGTFSASKGFGILERDGFNVFASLSYDKEERILASQRTWSRGGVRDFTGTDGQRLRMFQVSPNGDPPNVTLFEPDFTEGLYYNPILQSTGKCGTNPNSYAQDGACFFDYSATVDLLPKVERKNGYFSAQMSLGSDFFAFGEALFADSSVKAGFAPPAQGFLIESGERLYDTYVAPTLPALGLTPAEFPLAQMGARLTDAGQRRDDYRSKGTHLVLGVRGVVAGFDVESSFTSSKTDYTATNIGGYASRIKLNELFNSGGFDPFAQGSQASRDAIAGVLLNNKQINVDSKLDVLKLRGSGPIFKIGEKEAFLGLGVDFTKQSYSNVPDSIYQGPNALSPGEADFPAGGSNGTVATDASRKSQGAFAELVVPLHDMLEVTAAARYDSFDAASNKYIFSSDLSSVTSGVQGNKNSKSTYKIGIRFQPMKELLLRASVGTGFRAPSLSDIVTPLTPNGVIATQRPCPVTAGDPLFPGCRSTPTQYEQYAGGNPFTGTGGLKPETSKQWTAGLRWEPSSEFTAGFDLWSVRISNAITTVPEDVAFDNFATYRGLFSVVTDSATGLPILALNAVSVNSAVNASKGLDWDFTLRNKFSDAVLTTRFMGTYLIDSHYDLGFGDGKESSLGRIGADDNVAFRVLARLQATLDTGPFSNSVTMNFRPGYLDQRYTAADAAYFSINDDGTTGAAVAYLNHRVPSYVTLDWQGSWKPMKGLTLTAGIKNLLDKEPPFTIKSVAGNQIGVDPRYHDVVGRSFYIQGNYKF